MLDILSIPKGNSGGHIAHIGGALFGYLYIKQLQKGKDLSVNFNNFTQQLINIFRKKNTLNKIYKRAKSDYEFNSEKATKQKENIRILLEEKKIAEEVRKNIEEENSQLKNKIFNLQTMLSDAEKAVEEQITQKEEIEFLKLNLLYGHKCRKTMFNKLHKVGTPEYKNCVLQKGKI